MRINLIVGGTEAVMRASLRSRGSLEKGRCHDESRRTFLALLEEVIFSTSEHLFARLANVTDPLVSASLLVRPCFGKCL